MFAIAVGSVPIFIIGAVIWKFKMVEVIAGYDEDKVVDKDGMARWVGASLMVSSVIMIASYYFLKQFDISGGTQAIIAISLLLVLLTITAVGTRRYEKH